MVISHTFEVWQDHDSIQEAYIKTRPVCICCGGRVLGNVGIICGKCLRKVGIGQWEMKI